MDHRVIKFYDEHLAKHGTQSPEALAWRNDDSQVKRFKVLSEVADLSGKSILDEGCGLGDLYGYLKPRFRDFTYKGIDINEKLIEAGRHKYPGVDLQVADFSTYEGERSDFVLASGTLTFMVPDYKNVYFAQIMKMFDMARIGVAFNMLDAAYWAGDETYATYSLPEVYEFCARLTPTIEVRHDYAVEDFTFYLYH